MKEWNKIISPRDVEEARSYLPMAEKLAFAARVADRCRLSVRLGVQDAGEQIGSVPDMHAENTEKKMRFMLGALVKLYFGADFEGADDDEYLLSEKDYDQIARYHPMNQLERLKGDKSVRDKCFDLMQDYRALEKLVNAEIYSTLQIENDPITRLLAYMQTSITPESLQSLAQQAEAAKGELDAFIKERDANHGKT